MAHPLPAEMLAGIADDDRNPVVVRAQAMGQLLDRISECAPSAVEERLVRVVQTARGALLTNALEALAQLGRPPELTMVLARYGSLDQSGKPALLEVIRSTYGESVAERLETGSGLGTLHLVDESAADGGLQVVEAVGTVSLHEQEETQ